jgi:HD-GYP domain-containing protein (c-di-GMP phosphodiesterase class II)
MGGYYKFDPAAQAELFLAASLHDIGKLATPTAILEKPGKLNDEEFAIIKDHVRMTWEILKNVEGLADISTWASSHHEKLDGTGYFLGKKAGEMDFNSRLLACIDIYQAVSEERPYHPKRSHGDTMQVLNKMADNGKIDGNIVKDMDMALAQFEGKDIPRPEMQPC